MPNKDERRASKMTSYSLSVKMQHSCKHSFNHTPAVCSRVAPLNWVLKPSILFMKQLVYVVGQPIAYKALKV